MCNRDLSRVNGGLSRVASISLRERGVSDGAYVGSLPWLLGALEVKILMQGCPYFDLCLVFASQQEGVHSVDREFQSGLAKAFRSLPPLKLIDVSGDSFAKVFTCMPAPSLPDRMPF